MLEGLPTGAFACLSFVSSCHLEVLQGSFPGTAPSRCRRTGLVAGTMRVQPLHALDQLCQLLA